MCKDIIWTDELIIWTDVGILDSNQVKQDKIFCYYLIVD